MADWYGGTIENDAAAASPAERARALPAHWRTVSLAGAALLAIVSLLGAVGALTSGRGPTRLVQDATPLSGSPGPATPAPSSPAPSSPAVASAGAGQIGAAGGVASAFAPPFEANGDVVFTAPERALPTSSRAGLPTALMAASAVGPVIAPSMARDVVATLWKLRADALDHSSPSKLASFETGLALEVDTGRCECGGGNPFGPIDDLALSIPRQSSYPASFMAEVATTAGGKPYVAFLVVQRTSASVPWLLAFAGGFAPDQAAQVTPPATDGDGYLAPQTAAAAIDPGQAHAALAAYWRDAKRTGSVPATTTFAPGVWTTDFAKVLDVHHQGDLTDDGLHGYYAYQADPGHDPVFAFAEGRGWQIVCSAVRVQKTFSGSTLDDGPYQDQARENWGPSVAPGVHTAVIVTMISVPCIEIPPASSGQGARVLGADEHPDTAKAVDVR